MHCYKTNQIQKRKKINPNFNFKSKKAQVSMEHVMMIAVALLTIIPVIYLFYTYSQKSTEEIRDNQVLALGRRILNNAESIYYLGEPSKITLDDSMPRGLAEIQILKNETANIYELVFITDNNVTLAMGSKVPINADFTNASISEGAKVIVLESKGTYVNITIT